MKYWLQYIIWCSQTPLFRFRSIRNAYRSPKRPNSQLFNFSNHSPNPCSAQVTSWIILNASTLLCLFFTRISVWLVPWGVWEGTEDEDLHLNLNLDQNHTWNEPGTRSLSELIGRELNAISSQGSDAAFFKSIYLMKRDQSMWIKPVYKGLCAVWSPQNGLFLKIHRFFSDCFRDFSVEISDDQLKVARNVWKLF